MNNVIYTGMIYPGRGRDKPDSVILTEEANGFACWFKEFGTHPQLLWYRCVLRDDAIELAVMEARTRRER